MFGNSLSMQSSRRNFFTRYPLDGLANVAFAFSSARRLRSAYTGPLVRSRRSNDNVEQDIAWKKNLFDFAAFKNFIGSNSAYHTTGYDQSGNNKHAVQTIASQQPLIATNGQINLLNGRPAANWLGTSVLTSLLAPAPMANVSELTVFAVATNKLISDVNIFFSMQLDPQRIGTHLPWYADNNIYWDVNYDTGGLTSRLVGGNGLIIQDKPFQITYKNSVINSQMSFYVNGQLGASQVAQSTAPVAGLRMGAALDGTASWNGPIAEMIVFNTAVPDQVRKAIELDQCNFYGIKIP